MTARIEVDTEFLQKQLFMGLSVQIVDVRYMGDRIIIVVDGPAVPKDCEVATVIYTEQARTVHLKASKP